MMGHSASHVLTAEIIGHVKFESSDLFFLRRVSVILMHSNTEDLVIGQVTKMVLPT